MKDDDDRVSAAVEAPQARILSRGRGNRLRLEAIAQRRSRGDASESEVAVPGRTGVGDAGTAPTAPTATKPDRGPCTIYLETTTGGRFLRKLGTCEAAGSFATTTAGWPSGTSGGVALPLRVG